MDNNYIDPTMYPCEYYLYLQNPYRFAKTVIPYENLLVTVMVWLPSGSSFIFQIEDITTGTPKPIISKTGSFWEELENSDNIHAFLTRDKTEILIEENKKIYRYAMIRDDDQQPLGTVQNGKDH